jgi:hypothetical protein
MKLISLTKIISDGKHNAFTGLGHFQNRYFLAFRQAEKHGSEGGRQILLSSTDTLRWDRQLETSFPTPEDLPPKTPMDFRDNYFLNLGSELRIYSFALTPLGPDETYLQPVRSTVQTTSDGVNWSAPRTILQGALLWKPILHEGRFWCAGYQRVPNEGLVVDLYQSPDGFSWERGSRIATGNETILVPQSDGALWAYVRTQDAPQHLQIWAAAAPLFNSWRQVGVIPKVIEAPHIVTVGDGKYLCGREKPDRSTPDSGPHLCRSKIWQLQGTQAHEVLELPSLGDTSYFGTVVCDDGTIVASYYSQHERELDKPEFERGGNDKPADIFIARLKP